MLCWSTPAEYREGLFRYHLSRTSQWIGERGGLTLPWETAQSRSIPKDVASYFLQWTCVKEISYQYSSAGIWPRFGHLCVAPSVLIPFPNSSATFVTSSELSDLIWYSSDLMECTLFTSSTKTRLSAQRRRARWDYIFAFYRRYVFYWLIQWLNWYHGVHIDD